MSSQTMEQKQQQFHEFFSIKHPVQVNLQFLSTDFALPPIDSLSEHMPDAFRIASEVASIEAQALRPLRSLGDHAAELVNFLNHQSRKIDLIMSLVLQQQDQPTQRFNTRTFGAGGISLLIPQAVEPGTLAELKIFLQQEAAAVFCYAEVIECVPVSEGDKQGYQISLIYSRIREEDQELLVRASLHIQTQQLKKKRTQA